MTDHDITTDPAADAAARSSSRRGLLKLAGAAAAGAVGATVAGALPAKADNGVTQTDPAQPTTLTYTGSAANTTGFLFRAGGSSFNANQASYPSALSGWAGTGVQSSGVFGFTEHASGNGVVGRANAAGANGVFGVNNNGAGVRGEGATFGVVASGGQIGVSGSTQNGTQGIGVFGDAGTGVKGSGANIGVHGDGATAMRAEGNDVGLDATAEFGPAIKASSPAGHGIETYSSGGDGVYAFSLSNAPDGSAGVRGSGGDYALATGRCDKAAIYLQPNNNLPPGEQEPKTPPRQRTDAHLVGELESVDGDLWFCVASGTPGTWRKITGPAVAGGFHPVTPGRVFDSRQAQPGHGPIAAGENRTISVADRRDALKNSGEVVQADFVPAGATAIAANVTITNTKGGGYLVFNPGGVTTVGASTINWKADDQDIANGVILTLDNLRTLTVVAGGGGSTDFIVDVTGYYL